jgi:hypothetical protein
MRECHDCAQLAHAPEKLVRYETVRFKASGWIGDKFIPRDRKRAVKRQRTVWLCGICHAREQIPYMRERGDDVSALEYLIEQAEKETTARRGKPTNGHKGSDAASTKPKVSRNGTGRKRKAHTTDSAVLFQHTSQQSVDTLAATLTCDCMPYVDILTFSRWKAHGLYPTGPGMKIGRNHLWCRHMVKESEMKAA